MQNGFLVVGLFLYEVSEFFVEAFEDSHNFLEELRVVLVIIGKVS